MFLNSGDIHVEFVADDHYFGPARNRSDPSLCVVVDCYQGYMVLVHMKIKSTLKRFGW